MQIVSLLFLIMIYTQHILFDRDNRCLFSNYTVTGECINIFHQRKPKSNLPKISITSDNSAFFLTIVFVMSRVFNRKWRQYLKLFGYFSNCDISFKNFQIKYGFPFSFTSLQKCSINDFFNLETITSCYYIQHNITFHKNVFCLAIANLKYKDHTNFYQFLLLLSGDVSPNPGPLQNVSGCEQ